MRHGKPGRIVQYPTQKAGVERFSLAHRIANIREGVFTDERDPAWGDNTGPSPLDLSAMLAGRCNVRYRGSSTRSGVPATPVGSTSSYRTIRESGRTADKTGFSYSRNALP